VVSKNKRILKLPLRVWHDLPMAVAPAGTPSASSLKLGSQALNETSTAKTIMLTNTRTATPSARLPRSQPRVKCGAFLRHTKIVARRLLLSGHLHSLTRIAGVQSGFQENHWIGHPPRRSPRQEQHFEHLCRDLPDPDPPRGLVCQGRAPFATKRPVLDVGLKPQQK
jgi:hypothetical protein